MSNLVLQTKDGRMVPKHLQQAAIMGNQAYWDGYTLGSHPSEFTAQQVKTFVWSYLRAQNADPNK